MSLIEASEDSTPSTAPIETLVVSRGERPRKQIGENALVRFGRARLPAERDQRDDQRRSA